MSVDEFNSASIIKKGVNMETNVSKIAFRQKMLELHRPEAGDGHRDEYERFIEYEWSLLQQGFRDHNISDRAICVWRDLGGN